MVQTRTSARHTRTWTESGLGATPALSGAPGASSRGRPREGALSQGTVRGPAALRKGAGWELSSPLFMLGWAFAVARGEGLAWMPHVLSYCNMLPICFRKLSGNCFANCPRSLTLAALLFSVISLCAE